MGCFESKHKGLSPPKPLGSNSRQEWIMWRQEFLNYLNKKNVPSVKQGHHLFEYIGKIGEDISKNFYFYDQTSEMDVNSILFKFDVYFTFGGRKIHHDESIENYIKALKIIAEKTAKKCTEKVIKEKILQDLVHDNAFEVFLKVVPSFSEIITNYESLSLDELIFIWEQSHKPSIENESTVRCCSCGLSHKEKTCPALGKECSKCKKLNHFHWKCFSKTTLCCDFCGQSHVNSPKQCAARHSICSICRTTGHFSFKCRSQKEYKNST